MSRTLLPAALLIALPAGALAGCGGDDEDRFEAYCDVVRAEQSVLTEALATDGSAGLLPGLPSFERLRDAAPDDIADDWAVLVQRLTVLDDALRAADVDPASYDPTDPPESVSDEEREAIEAGASGVATESVREALQNVEQQARDVCKTELAQ